MHEVAEHSCCTFIIDAVEDTWIHELRNVQTIYANITTKALIDHLQLLCSGIHTLKVVDLISKIITYYGDASGVVNYINMLQ